MHIIMHHKLSEKGGETVRINISQILAYERCPTYWAAQYLAKRGPEQNSKALRLGNRWHDLCEHDKWRKDSKDTPTEELQLRYGLKLWREARAEWGISIFDTEVALEMELGGHTLFGQIDAIVRWNGRTWNLQHKTLAETTPLMPYTRALARSWHELGYGLLAKANGFEDYAGSIIVVLRKMAKVRKKQWGNKMLSVEPIILSPAESFQHELEERVGMMGHYAFDYAARIAMPQNRSNCLTYNQLCPYIDVCDGEKSILELPETNALERYENE